MFPQDLIDEAQRRLADLERRSLRLATAESCTGGLLSALLTEIPGCSHVLERGFVTYSNDAKSELLGVPADLIAARGAVSREVAQAMAEGALKNSSAHVAVSITGVAGPDGGSAEKPVGLVHIAAARTGGDTLHREHRFGAIGRSSIRLASVRHAMALLATISER